MKSAKVPHKTPGGVRIDVTKRTPVWWDTPEALSGHQLKKIVQQKNNEDLNALLHHPSKLGLSTDADTNKIYQTINYIVTQPDEYYLAQKLKVGNQLKKVAVQHGDFTPLTEPYRSIGGVTVFDEMLIRRAIRTRIPARLQSMENLRPHISDKSHHLERFLPSMNMEMRALLASVKSPGAKATLAAGTPRPRDKKRLALALHPAEDLCSPTDGGYVSWCLFMKKLHDCNNKIVRGRDLSEFVDQSEQYVEEQLKKLRLKNVVTLVYDSPHLGGASHILYSTNELQQLIGKMDPEVRNSERRSFLSYLHWIDVLLTSISNVRLREIISWKPLTYVRVEELRNNFEPDNLNRAPRTQRKVTKDNATDLVNQVHEKWKKIERAKGIKYEKFLRRKQEEVFWTLRNPNWAERAVKRKKETFTDRYHQKRDVLRVNTWYSDLEDQCKVVMGTVKPMKMVERFGAISWDHFNFALERLALVFCSLSSRDLTDLQMRAAARFVLREVLGGPEDLISRCFKYRGIPYELPFLRPGRGKSLVMEVEEILNQPKPDDYRFYNKLSAELPTVFASIDGMTKEGSNAPVLKHPVIDVRGSMKPISLPVRSHLPPSTSE
ncbi:hypothetical protein BV898_05215 [Hypsibius exemplaris]|uniref:Uncharacterized protein n=1 Tax=Hypsibius exemplaris TaxID=2072580 RepID=A0A1W0X095_HYPEX|nr:hypothetical protein BV898_05215 [Hypsibius exemplaris]